MVRLDKYRQLQAELRKTRLALSALQRTTSNQQLTERRAVLSTAPGIVDEIRFLFVGPHSLPVIIHLGLVPDMTQQWLKAKEVRYQQHGLDIPCCPLFDQDFETVKLYRLYLYTGKLFSKSAEDVDVEDDGAAQVHEDAEWHKLVLLYFLGIEARDEAFTNVIIDAIVEKVQQSDRWPTGLAREVYAHTRHGDRLRKLYVDLHVWVGQGTGIRRPHEDANGPFEFLDDVRTAKYVAGWKVGRKDVPSPWEQKLCELYHRHDFTAMCGNGLGDVETVDLTAEDE